MKSLLYTIIIINVMSAEEICAQNNAIFGGGSSDGFAIATVGSSGSEVPLPIQLLSFKGKCGNKNIVLEWSTASEMNNDYFTLERSKDATQWTHVCHVKGAGHSSTVLNYVFTDENPSDDVLYYRLKQTDFDGKFVYSATTTVENCSGHAPGLIIYPNPSNGVYTITATNVIISIRIYNLLGELIYQRHDLNELHAKIDISELPKGIYVAEINCSNLILTKKVINQ